MLLSTNGTRFYTSDTALDEDREPSFSTISWVEIAEVEALGGGLGGAWETVDATDLTSPHRTFMKSIMTPNPLQLVMGIVLDNPGQLALWSAWRAREAFPFKLVFPGNAVSRSWGGLVLALDEVWDRANSVIRLQAEIQPTTAFIKDPS